MDRLDQMDQLKVVDLMELMDHQFLLFPHSQSSHHHPYQSC